MQETITAIPLFSHPEILTASASATNSQSSNEFVTKSKWWNDQLYLDRFSPSPELQRSFVEKPVSVAELATMLRADTEHLVRELSLAETKTTYSLSIDSKQFLGEGYGDESLELMLSNFVQLLTEKGLSSSRAVVELLVFERVKKFFAEYAAEPNLAPDTPKPIVIITSPPDTQQEGYHGIDSLRQFDAAESHHSFIYVMEITGQENSKLSIQVTQYRTWHNLAGLLALHSELGGGFIPDPNVPLPQQLFANTLLVPTPDVATIHTQLEQLFYQDAASWVRRPDQAPSLENRGAFDQEWRQFFEDFYLPEALRLYQRSARHPDLLPPHHVLAQLELLFSFFIRAVEKRVQELNTNPLYLELLEQQLLADILKYPDKATELEARLLELQQPHKPQPLRKRQATINKAYRLQVKHDILGEQLTRHEANWYNANLTGVISISNFVMGSAQCYTLAPFTTAAQMGRAFSTPGETLRLFSASLETTSLFSRQELYQDLLKQDYVEIRLPGTQKVYMVPKSYLAAPGCRVTPEGKVLGPCDVLLDDDPLALPMTQPEFNQFLLELGQSLAAEETAAEIFDQQPDSIRQQGVILLQKIYKKIFKPSVGLNALITSSTYQLTHEAFRLPPEFFWELKNAANPLQVLEQMLLSLNDETGGQEQPDPTALVLSEALLSLAA